MRIDIFFYLLLVLISFLVCFFFLLLFFIFFHLSPSLLSSIALVTSSLLASKLRFSIITLSIFLIRIALRLFPTSSSFLFSSSCFPCLFCFLFYLRYSTFLLSRNRVVSHNYLEEIVKYRFSEEFSIRRIDYWQNCSIAIFTFVN